MKELAWKLIARFLSQSAVRLWLGRRAERRPYTPIYKDGELYMSRFWIFNPYALTDADRAKQTWLSKKLPSARIHVIHKPDIDRHPHSHPWRARSILLDNGYHEQRVMHWSPKGGTIVQTIHRKAGDTFTLAPDDYHMITALDGDKPVTTLFITWEYAAKWGFLVDGVHVYWKTYLGLDKEDK